MTSQRLFILFLLGAAACSHTEAFIPTERVSSQVEGYGSAVYDISTSAGTVGEAQVFSKGAYRDDKLGTVVHVGVELENNSKAPLDLDVASVELQSLTTSHQVVKGLRPAEVIGDTHVAPGSSSTVEFRFQLPNLKPHDVDAFRLRWSANAEGGTYAQSTPFAEYEPFEYAYTPYWDPFWDPYYYGYPYVYYNRGPYYY